MGTNAYKSVFPVKIQLVGSQLTASCQPCGVACHGLTAPLLHGLRADQVSGALMAFQRLLCLSPVSALPSALSTSRQGSEPRAPRPR